jgi:hypothetical protein
MPLGMTGNPVRLQVSPRRAPPQVLSLAAFGRRPLLYVAPLSLAGIRNPQQEGDIVAV